MAWGLVSMRQEFSSSVTLHPPMEEAENSLCACSYVPGWDWGLGQVPPKGNGAVQPVRKQLHPHWPLSLQQAKPFPTLGPLLMKNALSSDSHSLFRGT